jgi:uncharacterized membrane protein YkvA (DUF1232 family)
MLAMRHADAGDAVTRQGGGTLPALKDWARSIRRDVVAIWFAARDPATPMAVRLLALVIAAYALSPIDLIPDFIPVLGYLDDLLLVPLGLLLVIRLLPPQVLASARQKATAVIERPRSRAAAAVIIAIWLVGGAALAFWMLCG